MAKKQFDGQFFHPPWRKWGNAGISPDYIKTINGKLIPIESLDLLIWKAGVYDRGDEYHRKPNEDLGVLYSYEWE
jgi:hypothetical protein